MRVGMQHGIPRCRHSGDNSCGVSNDKARVCGLWDAYWRIKVKGKVFPYSLPSVGPGAEPGVQAVSPQVT